MLWQPAPCVVGTVVLKFTVFSGYSSLSEFSHLDRGVHRTRVNYPNFRQKCKMLLREEVRSMLRRKRVFYCFERDRDDMGSYEGFIRNYMIFAF